MRYRNNRAFYSEPTISFPGRLHITADRIYIEVILEIDGKIGYQSFGTEQFGELVENLCNQDFYVEGYEEAYRHELFDIEKRSTKIQQFLFTNNKKTPVEIPNPIPSPVPTHIPIATPAISAQKNEELSQIVGSLTDYITQRNDNLEEPIRNDLLYEHKSVEDDAIIISDDMFGNEEMTNDFSAQQISSVTSRYIGLFANLHTEMTGNKPSPAKALLLMSIINLFEQKKHQSNRIAASQILERNFVNNWNIYFPSNLPVDFFSTFYAMNEESFWSPALNPSGKVPEANLDAGLVAVLRQKNGRSILRKTLYNRYLRGI